MKTPTNVGSSVLLRHAISTHGHALCDGCGVERHDFLVQQLLQLLPADVVFMDFSKGLTSAKV